MAIVVEAIFNMLVFNIVFHRAQKKEHKGPPPYPKLSGEAGMLREKRRINRKVLKACAPW